MLRSGRIAAVFRVFVILLLLPVVVSFVVGYRDECIMLLLDARDELCELDVLQGFEDVFGFDCLVVVEDGSVVGTGGPAALAEGLW